MRVPVVVWPTGLMPRWYVFPRQIWQPRPSSWSTVIPFRVPWVPTGMNTGVLTAQCGSIRSQALAFVTGHSATTRRARGDAADKAFFRDMLFSEALASAPHSVAAAMLQWPCDVKPRLQLIIELTNRKPTVSWERRKRLLSVQSECSRDGRTAKWANRRLGLTDKRRVYARRFFDRMLSPVTGWCWWRGSFVLRVFPSVSTDLESS